MFRLCCMYSMVHDAEAVAGLSRGPIILATGLLDAGRRRPAADGASRTYRQQLAPLALDGCAVCMARGMAPGASVQGKEQGTSTLLQGERGTAMPPEPLLLGEGMAKLSVEVRLRRVRSMLCSVPDGPTSMSDR